MLYHFKLFKAGKEETRIFLWVCFSLIMWTIFTTVIRIHYGINDFAFTNAKYECLCTTIKCASMA